MIYSVPDTKGEAVKYYKLLNSKGIGKHSGKPWLLPIGDKPGPWMPKIDNIELCRSGYHACEFKNVLDWADEVMWEVELRGEIITGNNKVVAQEARLVRRVPGWNDITLRRFACACALDVLPIFERDYPGDLRPRRAIETAIALCGGRATAQELAAAWAAARAAAGDAAWAAARDAAWAEAWDAARDAQIARLKRMVLDSHEEV